MCMINIFCGGFDVVWGLLLWFRVVWGYPKVRKGVLFAKRTPFREKDLISRKGPKKQVLDWLLLITLLC